MVDGRVFNGNTLFSDVGDAIDDAVDRSVRVKGIIEQIIIGPADTVEGEDD
jgi:hypothetical protein